MSETRKTSYFETDSKGKAAWIILGLAVVFLIGAVILDTLGGMGVFSATIALHLQISQVNFFS